MSHDTCSILLIVEIVLENSRRSSFQSNEAEAKLTQTKANVPPPPRKKSHTVSVMTNFEISNAAKSARDKFTSGQKAAAEITNGQSKGFIGEI